MNEQEIFDKVQGIISEQLGVEKSQVTKDANCDALHVSRHGQLHYAQVGLDATCEAQELSWQMHYLLVS